MFVESTPFNEICDLEEVQQVGYMSIVECLEHGVVPGDLALVPEDEGNGIDNPSRIVGHVHDVFHAEREKARLSRSVKVTASADTEQE